MSPRGAAAARVAGVCALLGCTGLAVAAVGGDTGRAGDLLPNLDQAAPTELRVRAAGTPGRRAWRLGFTSRIANRGPGALTISAARSGDEMTAGQVIARRGALGRTRARVATLRYVRAGGHEHWHMLGLQRFELHTASGGRVRTRVRKQGLCLGDREPLPGSNSPRRYPGRCGLREPLLRTLEQGLSPGWTDPYPPSVEGQELDITRLPAGRYVLVHRADPGGRLLETTRRDNAASVLLTVRRASPLARPSVRLLERCPRSARCGR